MRGDLVLREIDIGWNFSCHSGETVEELEEDSLWGDWLRQDQRLMCPHTWITLSITKDQSKIL
jgi:hypothetical protein